MEKKEWRSHEFGSILHPSDYIPPSLLCVVMTLNSVHLLHRPDSHLLLLDIPHLLLPGTLHLLLLGNHRLLRNVENDDKKVGREREKISEVRIGIRMGV